MKKETSKGTSKTVSEQKGKSTASKNSTTQSSNQRMDEPTATGRGKSTSSRSTTSSTQSKKGSSSK